MKGLKFKKIEKFTISGFEDQEERTLYIEILDIQLHKIIHNNVINSPTESMEYEYICWEKSSDSKEGYFRKYLYEDLMWGERFERL